MATTSMTRVQGNASRWVRHGVVGEVIARLVFAVFEMVMAAVLDGAEACSMPLRRLGAMVLKQEAFDPGYSLVGAGAAASCRSWQRSVSNWAWSPSNWKRRGLRPSARASTPFLPASRASGFASPVGPPCGRGSFRRRGIGEALGNRGRQGR